MSARDRLRARQSEVLDAVLTGVVPEGFDAASTRVTGLVLRAKRRTAAVHALPLLAEMACFTDHFDTFARQGPARGCAHDDARSFLDWAEGRGLLNARSRRAWHGQQVEDGERRLAVVSAGGRRRLLVGVGSWVYDVPVWPVGHRSLREGD